VSTADPISAADSTPAASSASVNGARDVAPPAAGLAWLAAARLTALHLRSRRVPSALVALAACGLVLWAALVRHWWLGTGPAASELPMIIEACAAGIIAVSTHSPFGEPERATGRWLPFLRLSMALALCGTAIGLLALGAAAAYNPQAGVYLTTGIIGVAENVMGFAGIGLIFCALTGGLTAWTGPLGFMAICQFALVASYSEPLTWAARPSTDRGGWIAAMAVYTVGLAVFTIRGPRVRPSGE
jgi:hypothetical protein